MQSFNHFRMLGLGLFLLAVGGWTDRSAGRECTEKAEPSVNVLEAQSSAVCRAASTAARRQTEPPSPPAKRSETPPTFTPPFPDREDLFLPPKRPSAVTTTRPRDPSSAVTLRGFVNVGVTRVVLAIHGTITHLKAGESRGDLRVLAIDPPRVTLEQGDRQWTESLFESPSDTL